MLAWTEIPEGVWEDEREGWRGVGGGGGGWGGAILRLFLANRLSIDLVIGLCVPSQVTPSSRIYK